MLEALNDPIFARVASIAEQLSTPAYVVGGYVRDWFLGRPLNDIDIVVVGSGIEVADRLGCELGVNVSVFKNFGTAMLRQGGTEIEFVGARRESYRADSRKPAVEDGTLEDDQNRRDFTINAMAFSLNKGDYGRLVDPFGGMRDLEDKIIRTPLDPDRTFSDDPLRMMRAVRFATQLGFEIAPGTFESIRRNRERLNIISEERISGEMEKIMASDDPARGFRLLDASGLLELILPELTAMKGVDSVKGQEHKDNFVHTLKVLENIVPYTDDVWLRWAALLHDIGKPRTKAWDDRVGWTFHQHEVVGSKMTPVIFRRLKMPMNEKMKFVQKMVFLHLRPIFLAESTVTDSAVRRLLFDTGDDIDALMTLCEADITSANHAKVKRYMQNLALVRQKLVEIEEKDRIRNFQPPVTGDTIMQAYGIPPSRVVGEMKDAIKNAILDGEIPNDYDAAWQLMEKLADEHGISRNNAAGGCFDGNVGTQPETGRN